MTLTPPVLTYGDSLQLAVTNAKHIVSGEGNPFPSGQQISTLEEKIGSEAVLRSGQFDDMMFRALDQVSADERYSNALIQQAIVDPDSVDTHDITIAQAKASMSLNITRTVLSRLVQGWRDLINIR
ncbi:MAG: flagellar hook-basal body complex protein FliE [Treponema sp.]|jgi:flagellar hook-basal body complex protein FliE|nr:flagellar hook-basal body complex protein FliE [Treponema sp.]